MTHMLPKLAHAPVISIIGQVRFSPVLSIESYVPKIQEELRKRGYPKFEKFTQQSLAFGPDGGAMPPTVAYSWRFSDRDDSQIAILNTNAISLYSGLNQTAQEFDEALLNVISPVSETVGPELIERIGLRYINVIQPSATTEQNGGLSEYIQQGLLGLDLSKAGAKSSAWHIYSVNHTEYGILIFQARHPISEPFLPPDVLTGPVPKMRPLRNYPSLVLDLDHFVAINAPFAIDLIRTTIENFHSVIDWALILAVKESALAEWR